MINRISGKRSGTGKLSRAGMATVAVLALAFIQTPEIRGQDAAPREFEVATVKSSPPTRVGDLININLGNFRNGKLIFTNASLSDCLKFAYGIVSDAQISGPEWIKSKAVRFDIVAQAPPDIAPARLQLMLQALLADRLKLTLHHEQKELPFLALVPGKNGPKIREAKSDSPSRASTTAARGRILSSGMSMELLATLLSRFERQTVVNLTGLEGAFEVKLEWAADDGRPIVNDGAAPAPMDVASGPSIFTAVQEQLGLRLESRKGPLDVLVVDHAEQAPTEN
jgi:uncharacterized protein (TIGR03435 family)